MRILLADDHGLVRDALGDLLRRADAEPILASSLEEAIAMAAAASEPFNAIVLDYMMPGMNGLDGLEKMKAEAKGAPVAIISGAAAGEVASRAKAAGAAGFLSKTDGAEALVDAIHEIAEGEQIFPEEPIGPSDETGLTRREREVLSYLYKGLQNKEIARVLTLREVTVKLHVRSVCRKLKVANRTQAAMRGREMGVLPTI